MLIKKENWSDFIVREYPFIKNNLWIAIAHLKWRYPQKGKVINHKCDEIYYIIEWEGFIHTEEWDFSVKSWDAFFFEKKKRYRVETNNLKLLLPTSPSWYFEQYEEII